ncbi:MAG: hypothetical protein EAZ87_01540 [Nostocales cyanobacterium]|nr:MAG: hypothetical protein EAZ87_01540 [Nostocales cyanobacterium]
MGAIHELSLLMIFLGFISSFISSLGSRFFCQNQDVQDLRIYRMGKDINCGIYCSAFLSESGYPGLKDFQDEN